MSFKNIELYKNISDEYIKMLNTIKIDDYIEEKGKDILNNKFHLNSSLEIIEFKEKIDWDYISKKNKNSYQLYLQSLTPVSYLVNSYIYSNNKIYLDKALEIILSWNTYKLKKPENNMIWYDHTVASRILNLIFYNVIAIGNIEYDIELIHNLILEHIEFLMDDNNYRMNNHGIMMDKSLIIASYLFNNEVWRLKALERIKENFYSSFSLKGVHLENSTFYHDFVKNMFSDIEIFLNEKGISLGENIKKRLELANEYMSYIVKPDNFLPQIGDSKRFKVIGVEKKYNNFVDTDAGIAILQNKDLNNNLDSLWLSFVCGYYTKTHKQLDDLSINLYYKGRDILVDSGGYGYGTSKERAYVRSALSHSTILVKDEIYDINQKNSIKITDFIETSKYSLIRGKNDSYKNVNLQRVIIFIKPSTIIIKDICVSKHEKEFLQIFNFSKESNILKVDRKKSDIYIDGLNCSIRQFIDVKTVKKYNGDKNIPRAVISEKTGEIIEISQLEYRSSGKKVEFLSMISLDEKNNNVDIEEFNDDYIKILSNNESFQIIL